MLASVGRLLHCDRVFAFHHEAIEIFRQKHRDGLRHGSDDSNLDVVDFVQNGQSPVLKDRIGIQYEKPGFHKWRVRGKK